MNNLPQTLFGIVLACGILVVLWFTYRDSFDVDIPALATAAGCTQTVTESETKAITEFERRALESIGGASYDDEIPPIDSLENWKPSIESLKLLLNTNAIVDMAMSRLRASIVKHQQEDPNSLVNEQKAKISGMFDTAREWCAKLP